MQLDIKGKQDIMISLLKGKIKPSDHFAKPKQIQKPEDKPVNKTFSKSSHKKKPKKP